MLIDTAELVLIENNRVKFYLVFIYAVAFQTRRLRDEVT